MTISINITAVEAAIVGEGVEADKFLDWTIVSIEDIGKLQKALGGYPVKLSELERLSPKAKAAAEEKLSKMRDVYLYAGDFDVWLTDRGEVITIQIKVQVEENPGWTIHNLSIPLKDLIEKFGVGPFLKVNADMEMRKNDANA